MRRGIILLSVLLGVLLLLQQATKTSAKKATPEEIRSLLEGEEKPFFLDVREPKELEELGTLPGYVNIPLGQLESRLSEIPRDRLVITVCNRAQRAAKVAAILEKAGIRNIILCAMNDWKEKGFPVICPKASPKD